MTQLQILVGIHHAGIHATYFLSPENVMLKLQSYAHTEFDRSYATPTTADWGKHVLTEMILMFPFQAAECDPDGRGGTGSSRLVDEKERSCHRYQPDEIQTDDAGVAFVADC